MPFMLFKKWNILVALVVTAVVSMTAVSCTDDTVDDPVETAFEFLDNLSEFGFFAGDLYNLEPAAGVFLYDLSTPLFSDYTIKHRFIRLPENSSIDYTSSGPLDFPENTVIIKNFSSLDESDNEKRLETRLLWLDPSDGEWKVMVYLWNDAQTDASKHIIGQNLNIRVKNDAGEVINTLYKVPNTNDCKRCHVNQSVITPIGPKARSLNMTLAGDTQNQLDKMAALGYLAGLPSTGVPVLPDWLDEAHFTLDERARAYLDMNCAHCHTNGGDAYNTGLFLEYEQTDSSRLGVYKVPVSAGPGSGSLTYDLVPGNADESIIHFRMNSAAPGITMPELAKSVVHEEGVELIRDWINSL